MIEESAIDTEVRNVVNALWHDASKLSADKLLTIYRHYGGLATFSQANLSEYWQYLRNVLVRNEAFPVKEYDELVSAMRKFTADDVQSFGNHPRAVASLEIFDRLWAANRESMLSGVLFSETSALVSRPGFAEWMEKIVVHAPNCLSGVDVRDHYFCGTIRINHADREQTFMEEFQREFQANFHPDALARIQDEVLTLRESGRARYTASSLVREDHWAILLADKRNVMNAVAGSRYLPEQIAYSIISAHKTAQLRIDIAGNARSKALLDSIWHGTKSEAIRNAVAANSLSERDPLEALTADERRRLKSKRVCAEVRNVVWQSSRRAERVR